MKACVIGSTGYAGQQLASLLLKHPEITHLFLGSHGSSGKKITESYGHLRGLLPCHLYSPEELMDPAFIKSEGIDLFFFALPHGLSAKAIAKLLPLGVKIIDLGADFRLKEKLAYSDWYGEHGSPEHIGKAVYGLCELNKAEISNAGFVANPGCYATATILASAPAVKLGLIGTSTMIVDAKSGISGAGRSASTEGLYSEAAENLRPYSTGTHRHTPEIEQCLGGLGVKRPKLMFSPSVVPMSRGILSAVYAPLEKSWTAKQIKALYLEFYKDSPFIRVTETQPLTKYVRGSNLADLWVTVDERTNTFIAMAAIDNLMKGAAGQAVQNMNLMFGFSENLGLDYVPLYP